MTEKETVTMETIGVMMGFPASFAQGGEGVGLGFFPTTQKDDKLVVTAEMKEAMDMGFRPMVLVKANAENWLAGYELHLVEGLPSDVADMVKALSPMVIEKQFQNWRAWKAGQIARKEIR